MRVLSGIQPSGSLHIGNYFGAIRQYVALADKPASECFYFIADLHALTTVKDPAALRKSTLEIAKAYMAFGLDTERAVFFRQSDIPEVTQLYWILSNHTPMGLLERCHSYKDKTAKGIQPYHGLFSYPVLMAADILICKSDLVPVGRDQKQHVEVTCDIAQKFNSVYGPVLTIPKEYIMEDTAVVPGIDGQKMSKSYNNTIDLFADEKAVRKTIMSIVTDSTPVSEPKQWKTCALYALFSLFACEQERNSVKERYEKGGLAYGELKKDLFQKYMDLFGPARARYASIGDSEAEQVLKHGAARARQTASGTLDEVRRAVGLS